LSAEWQRLKIKPMTLASSELPHADKLDTLRRLDQSREWQSLDDRRYCLVCGNLITGWKIQVIAESPETGPLQIVCPTEHCNSIPMDWVLPTDELLATLSTRKGDPLPEATN
jgi:hypothetical protein